MADITGKALLIEALQGRITPRPAWVPFVGVHGASLVNAAASDYLQSADLIEAGLRDAARRYQPDGLPVVFDLQLEAQVLGCDLHWAADTPPSVTTHPLAGDDAHTDLPPFSTDTGRFPLVFEAMDRLKPDFDKHIALYGLICGPFTLAMHLRGHDLFIDMFDHEAAVHDLLALCTDVARQTAQAYIQHGADVVAIVDPMTSQISPQHFTTFVAPAINPIFDAIRERGAFSSLFVCGDATRNLEAMCDTRCDNLSIDENIALDRVRDLAHAKGKSFGGNLKLTTALLMGDVDDAQLDAIRCIDIGDHEGFILAPGCDLPFATPPANIQAVARIVHSEYQRQIARTTITARSAARFGDVQLPDYTDPSRIYIDVITLDSASCAPCQYMMDAVHKAAQQLEGQIDLAVHERKLTTRQGVACMLKLDVQQAPSICIDGRVRFSSITPHARELAQAILEAHAAKQSTETPQTP